MAWKPPRPKQRQPRSLIVALRKIRDQGLKKGLELLWLRAEAESATETRCNHFPPPYSLPHGSLTGRMWLREKRLHLLAAPFRVQIRR